MLRRTVTTVAGPRTFDVVSARIGNFTIDAAPAARFTVSVAARTATFRLQNISASRSLSRFHPVRNTISHCNDGEATGATPLAATVPVTIPARQ